MPKVADIIAALKAICEGYSGSIADGYIIVRNPTATPETIALNGVNPNLVIDCQQLISILEA